MFEKYLEERAAWSIETFGPLDHQRDTRAAAISDHIRKELLEIERSPHDLEEWIDVISLALDGALRCAGAASTEILPALVAKLEKCKARTWPDWRTHPPGNAVEHVRAPHRAQRVTADLAAVRAQELADFSPSATAISSPIEVRELPTLGNSQPRHADWIKNLPQAAQVEREDVGGRMRGSCGILDEHHTIYEMSDTIEKLTAELDTARETLQQIRDLLTVENDGPEGPMPSSWFFGQIRQILGIGISAEHDAETLDLSGGES